MSVVLGTSIPFEEYLARTKRSQGTLVVWPAGQISEALAAAPAGERGSISLTDPLSADPATLAPGLSGTLQRVEPGMATSIHSHSFWHLYLVRSGRGTLSDSALDGGQPVAAGDLLFVPAWTPHRFSNGGGTESLVLLAIQNLPQVAALGCLSRAGANGSTAVVYAD